MRPQGSTQSMEAWMGSVEKRLSSVQRRSSGVPSDALALIAVEFVEDLPEDSADGQQVYVVDTGQTYSYDETNLTWVLV